MNLIRKFICDLYEMVFIDLKTGEMSHTKFWSNIGYLCLCWSFIYQVLHNQADFMVSAVFATVVVGNRTLLKFINKDPK